MSMCLISERQSILSAYVYASLYVCAVSVSKYTKQGSPPPGAAAQHGPWPPHS